MKYKYAWQVNHTSKEGRGFGICCRTDQCGGGCAMVMYESLKVQNASSKRKK